MLILDVSVCGPHPPSCRRQIIRSLSSGVVTLDRVQDRFQVTLDRVQDRVQDVTLDRHGRECFTRVCQSAEQRRRRHGDLH